MINDDISRITCITNRMKHHAGKSGYDRLSEFLNANIILTSENLILMQRVIARICRSIIKNSGSKWYHRSNLMTELITARKWIFSKNNIFHFLYGENSFRYLGNIKSIHNKNRILCTYHTPKSRFQEVVKNKSHLRFLDAAVVVSTTQIEFLSNIIDPARIFFVPHGIDVDYFQPRVPHLISANPDSIRCIFVGNHMRDFVTLRKIAEILLVKEKRITFVIVASSKNCHYFNHLCNVEYYTSVSDDELLALYQSSNFLIMPLLDCTANNALLEGMACGLPIVATDLSGVRDYVNESCGILVRPNDADAMAAEILSLANDQEKCMSMGVASRLKAMEYEWSGIAQQMQNIYEHIS